MTTTETQKHTSFNTVKSASPETLFARYLQKQGKKPTKTQISNWEYDGGPSLDNSGDFVLIHGHICRTFSEKMKAYLTYYWRLARLYIRGDQTY